MEGKKLSYLNIDEINKTVPQFSSVENIEREYIACRKMFERVIVVIDDDPTGIQTVHGIDVYMDWKEDLLVEAFEKSSVFYIQTNSRSMPAQEAARVNAEIMENIIKASRKTGRDFSVISRSDSTLRWHYPLETAVLRNVFEKETGQKVDGEILIPFFLEAGRFTYNDVHYVQDGQNLIPAGETEFAKDSVFAFEKSDLKYYIEEKTKGEYIHDSVSSISIDSIRGMETDKIYNQLLKIENFGKVIVNCLCYDDLKVFTIALLKAEKAGKRFIFRSAASFVKVYGFIDDKKLLGKEDFGILPGAPGKILVLVGSHVKKTTDQLEKLLECPDILPVELCVDRIIANEESREKEIGDKLGIINDALRNGKNPALYTSRKLLKVSSGNKEDNLLISRTVSDSLSKIVRLVSVRPDCVISKGGITSSDIAVKGLGIVKANVLGQVLPGIPVIKSGAESKWPGMPYVIFPGNVGDENSLAVIYNELTE